MAHIHNFNGKKTGSGQSGVHSHELPDGNRTGAIDGSDTDNHTHSLPNGQRTGGPLKVSNKEMANALKGEKK